MKPSIDECLKAWKVEFDAPARFQADVWQRISLRQSSPLESPFEKALAWFTGLIAKPQYATALILVSVSIGLGSAHLEANTANSRNMEKLESRYMQSIDPVAKVRIGG